ENAASKAPSAASSESAVAFDDLYPGIDMIYTPNGADLEYSFIINPGADPADIALDFDGATTTITEAGDLLIDSTSRSHLLSTAPFTYQDIESARVEIPSAYEIRPDGAVGFTVGAFDPTRPLVIDPTFVAVDSSVGLIPDGGTLSLPVPAGVTSGDVLIAQVSYNAPAGSTITPAAGWTVIDIEENASHDIIQALYWRVATGAEPAQYGFDLTSGAANTATGAIVAYGDVDTTDPIDAFGAQSNGTSTSLVAPSITTTESDTTLVALFSNRSNAPLTPPAGMTERWDISTVTGVGDPNETAAEGAEETLGAAGPTGTRTASTTASDGSIGHLVALTPAPADPVVLDHIETGTSTIAGGSSSSSATIAAVDPTKSFLTFSVRGNNGDPANLWINGELTDATTVTFTRPGTTGNVTIEWSVVEYSSGVTVQRGSTNLTGTTTDVAITSSDLTKSFPMISSTATGTVFSNNDFVRAELTSATNLRLSISALGTNVVKWQVVTYNDASVQSGSVAFASGDASKTATVTTVDTSKAWLLYSLDTATGTQSNIGQKLVRGQVSDSTTLTFDRSNTGQTMNLTYYVVEFTDTTEVQHGTVPFLTADSTKNVAITSVDPTRAIGVGGFLQYGGRSTYSATDNPGVGWFTTKLTTSTNLQVQRDAALAPADLGWFVVHWPVDLTPRTFTVNSTGDGSDVDPGDGLCDTGGTNSEAVIECSLRAAIEESNATPTADEIEFAIPQTESGYSASPEAFTIQLGAGSGYPDIVQPVTIDGSTQPEYTIDPVIQLDGALATTATAGLVLETDDSLINALIVHSFADEGIEVDASTGGGHNNTIANNWGGFDASL
ncbi:MAG: CSLREA domain-containing protein, partial [Acidimicrobiia bacterium]